MLLEVRDSSNRQLGILDFRSGKLQYVGEVAQVFFRFVQIALRDGITVVRDEHTDGAGSYKLFEASIGQDDPNFAVAFKDFLRRAGFQVTILHPEIDEEIKIILADFPDDNSDKQDILLRLPGATFREKTFLLKKLTEIGKQN